MSAYLATTFRFAGDQHANHFAQHTTVGPELAATGRRPPDGGARRDGIDTTEDGVPDLQFGAIAVLHNFNEGFAIQAMNRFGSRQHLGLANILG